MTASGLNAFGSTLKWNGTALAELTNISGPNISVDTVEVTSHDSTSAFREFVPGLRDGGEVAVEGNFIFGNTGGQRALVTDATSGSAREVIIIGPTGSSFKWTFNAICTGLEFNYPHDGKLGFSSKFKVTGVPVLSTST